MQQSIQHLRSNPVLAENWLRYVLMTSLGPDLLKRGGDFLPQLKYPDPQKAYAEEIIRSQFSLILIPDYTILRMKPLPYPFPAHLLLEARYCPDRAFVPAPPGTQPGCGPMFSEVIVECE